MFNSKLKAQVADLTKALEHNRQRHASEVERLRDKLVQSERMRHRESALVDTKALVGLKFDAMYKGAYVTTVFTTGPGKCGKEVKSLRVSKNDKCLFIHQQHTDGTSKDFEYRLSDIDGRIQYDYEMVKVPRSEVFDIERLRRSLYN